jgi:DNA-binding beta-propeller fold protein YncE
VSGLARTVYVSNGRGDMVTPIAVVTGTPGLPIPVGRAPGEIVVTPDGKTAYITTDARAIAITPDGEIAYVVVWAEPGAVVPFAIATNTPRPPIQVGNGPCAIAIAP